MRLYTRPVQRIKRCAPLTSTIFFPLPPPRLASVQLANSLIRSSKVDLSRFCNFSKGGVLIRNACYFVVERNKIVCALVSEFWALFERKEAALKGILCISVISYRRGEIARDGKKWNRFACKCGNKMYIDVHKSFAYFCVVLVSVVKSLLRKKREE